MGSVAVAPGGKVIAYCSAGIVHVPGGHGRCPLRDQAGEPAGVCSPRRQSAAVRVTQQVRVLDAENGKELFLLGEPREGGPSAAGYAPADPSLWPGAARLAFTSDGKRVATAAGGRRAPVGGDDREGDSACPTATSAGHRGRTLGRRQGRGVVGYGPHDPPLGRGHRQAAGRVPGAAGGGGHGRLGRQGDRRRRERRRRDPSARHEQG